MNSDSVDEYREDGYGHDRVVLTVSDILSLLKGKSLCFGIQGGEYTCSIELSQEIHSWIAALSVLYQNDLT
ncbi:MAG: hypothetical protein L0Y56_00690 [Nitrospira sp.]|nr:hypothetical protein [Nitrospira sp.]